jgi:hypothetical protein
MKYPRTIQMARREAARRAFRIACCSIFAAAVGESQRQSNVQMGYTYVRLQAKQAWENATDFGRKL